MAHGVPARLLVLLALLLALGASGQAARLFYQDLLFTDVETELGFWGREAYHPTHATIEYTGQQLDRLLERAPADPRYLALLANYAAWRGYWAEDLAQGEQFNRRAVQAQYAGLESRPAHRHSWSKMLQYTSQIQDGKAMRATAQARLQVLQLTAGPDES